METPEIKFTLNDHDAIQSTATGIAELRRMIVESTRNTEEKIKTLQVQIDKNTKDGEYFHDFIIASKSERRTWSIAGGMVGGVVVAVISGMLLHFLGKI